MSKSKVSVTLNTCGEDIEYLELSVPSGQIDRAGGFFTPKVRLYPSDIDRLVAAINIFNGSKIDN